MLSMLRMKDKVNLPKRDGICSIFCNEKFFLACFASDLFRYFRSFYFR